MLLACILRGQVLARAEGSSLQGSPSLQRPLQGVEREGPEDCSSPQPCLSQASTSVALPNSDPESLSGLIAWAVISRQPSSQHVLVDASRLWTLRFAPVGITDFT